MPIEIGDSVWLYAGDYVRDVLHRWPPPESEGWWEDNFPSSVGSSHFVRGIVTITSATEAVFRADVNGAEFPMVRGGADDLGEACL